MSKWLSIRSGGCLLALCLALPVGAESLRDPTQPPRTSAPASTAATSPAGAMTLDSIIISATRRVAVINGEAVREGDRIEQAQVVRIWPDRVELSSNQTTTTLRLEHGESVRQSP